LILLSVTVVTVIFLLKINKVLYENCFAEVIFGDKSKWLAGYQFELLEFDL